MVGLGAMYIIYYCYSTT